MKKTEKQYQKYIETIVEKWVPRLHLQGYTIRVEKDPNTNFFASRFRYPYQDAVVLWTTRSFQAWSGGADQEREILHELFHVVTDPLYAKATTQWISKGEVEDERELLTDRLTVMLLKAFERKSV